MYFYRIKHYMSKTIRANSDKITKAVTLIDDIDLSILRLLQKNSRATVREIAEEVHLSATPVHERIKRMEREGVIQQYTILINPSTIQKSLKVKK